MEAPEKLYISDSELNDAEHCVIWFKSQQNKNDIEYIRKDAFIEKACEWIKEHKKAVETEDNGIIGWIPDYFIEDFRNYMEGE
jgi:hypothetical protein